MSQPLSLCGHVSSEYLPVSEGWSDELYITFQSSVGPNTVDILEYIIENYTDLTYDTASFNTCAQACAVPGQLPALAAQERHCGAQGDRLPGPLRILA